MVKYKITNIIIKKVEKTNPYYGIKLKLKYRGKFDDFI